MLILVATLITDIALGAAALKMAKAAKSATVSNSGISDQLAALLTKHNDRLENHEIRIVVLERKAA